MWKFFPSNKETVKEITLMKAKILFCIALTISALQSHAQEASLLDKVIAVVGSEMILLSDLEEQYDYLRGQQGGLPPDARCFILNNMMLSKLLLNQAKLDSEEVSEAEVDDQINARIDRILGYMGNDPSMFESYYGQTIAEKREEMREDIRDQILTERMQGKVQSGITITPSEVKAFFNKIPRDSLPYFNAEVEILEIVH